MPKPLRPTTSFYLVVQAAGAFLFGDGLQVRFESLLDLGFFIIFQVADAGAAPEAPVEVLVYKGCFFEEVYPGVHAGSLEELVDPAIGGVQAEGELVVAVVLDKRFDLFDVGPDVGGDQAGDVFVGDSLGPSKKGDARDHPL